MPDDVDTFLRAVLRSGLLNREQLEASLRAIPREIRQNPEVLADHLVKYGVFSRFQAHKLLQGAVVGLVLGPYQILAPIGRGGMGTVYLALDSRTKQHVAIKILPPKKAKEADRHLARFRREMELSQRVRHPNLALAYEVGVEQGVHYIAMEYIAGRSLHRLVMREGVLPAARAAKLFAEVCSGLDHAHSQGLIHRHLKPSNIMVTPNHHAKVLDLGLALMEGEVAEDVEIIGGAGYVVGSMDYMAPEQVEDSRSVDARADIYSLGCTLDFTLTGQPPFPGGSKRDKFRRHRQDEPEPIDRLNHSVPDQFIDLVRKMMAKKPELRYASAYDTREALLAWALEEVDLPMDQQNDSSFQEAITKLETAEVAEVGDVVVLESEPVAPGDHESAADSESTQIRRDYLWIAIGLGGFWLIVVLGFALVALLR